MTQGTRGLNLIVAGLLSFLTVGQATSLLSREEWTESSWASIEPSKELAWVPCYFEPLECTRLQVPLDYSDPEGESAAIAITRLKANVSADSPEYRGPILFNPGGPGNSGVEFVVGSGQDVAQIVGPEFDIVSFDPRGLSRSTPRIEWFESREERTLWYQTGFKELNHSSDNVASFYARSRINGQLVQERFMDLLPYFSTAHVAQDMQRIVEAHGRDKLQFWGFSYGSVLGATFAAMFPDKVERLIIDGIVDAESDYFTGQWKRGTLDTDKAINWFFRDCYNAGPELCAFYDSSPEAIEAKLNRLYESIIRAPVAVRTELSYGLVDYESLRSILLIALYAPAVWPRLASGLAGLEAGDGTAIWKVFEGPQFECACNSSKYAFERVLDGQQTYICNDAGVVPSSLDDAQKHWQESLEVSGWNSMFAGVQVSCSSWPEFPRDFFRGPISGNTSHPLLIIGNTADPVTSVQAAHVVSKRFPGSVVLTQDSSGHGSTAAPSICTANAVRTYFINGTLPEPGTICPIIGHSFDLLNSTSKSSKRELSEAGFKEEDIEVLHALKRMGTSSLKSRGLGISPFGI
ncbi:hypothetical protein VNI00_009779 [Paramarasmius palmivorus]|uniref:Alpha/beta-hydrolase n=1 Tax=Paramarasmius palmivorus TaxID=297713 RepID=A0AAW0CMU7_9AGAR